MTAPVAADGVRAAIRDTVRDDVAARARALLVARLAIALYLVELLLNLLRPHVLPNEPALSIFQRLPGSDGCSARPAPCSGHSSPASSSAPRSRRTCSPPARTSAGPGP
ncbi:hypothetical protein [Actinomadura sp. NTSP31]|uniref:hypothetical protein n=1 Tax=Actinomadura sp. NTSP31 TaxID=1735447 RepID=UPI0035C16483